VQALSPEILRTWHYHRYAEGGTTLPQLAGEYHVDAQTMRHAVEGMTGKHPSPVPAQGYPEPAACGTIGRLPTSLQDRHACLRGRS
jgi:hypothetical protein